MEKGSALSQEYFDGLIDDVRVYDRALADEEMVELFQHTPTPVGEFDSANIPTEYSLHQNYPNPFNPETHRRFGLPKTSHVKIELYNILGKRVKTLLDARMRSGYHIVDFDGSELASGIYIYGIQAGDFAESKKMVLLQ